MKNLNFSATEIKSGFWRFYSDLVRDVTVHVVRDRFTETGRIDAFSCSWHSGQPHKPHVFWDSDVAKWIEGVAYLTKVKREPELEKIVDTVADNIEKNQRSDGYFNSAFLTLTPAETFTNRGAHELYCIGHLTEAALAYNEATGKDKLLRCMLKAVDNIYDTFVVKKSAGFVTPGHEEIELALIKLYYYTKNDKHLELARFFIDMRGNNEIDDDFIRRQSHIPVRKMDEAVGHAVRACYLYTGMTMLANVTNDVELKAACDRIFSNIVNKKMSITGGIGATNKFEAFSYDYDLPNSTAYNETCAAISLALFAGELQEAEPNSIYGDIIERVYYNGFISGLSLSGDHFFYTNPLEIDQKKYVREEEYHPISERLKEFDCSCCPPNIVRMLSSSSRYMYTLDGDTIYCNQFADSVTHLTIGGKDATLTQSTDYPTSGKISFSYKGDPTILYVRIPAWCVEYEGATENGFARFEIRDGDTVNVDLPMNVHFIEANPNVQDNSGRYAVTRGPIVYCLEGVDNGENLRDITLLENGNIEAKVEELIAPVIYIDAQRRAKSDALYSIKNNERVAIRARLIPYFAFANRGKTDMLIWTMVK